MVDRDPDDPDEYDWDNAGSDLAALDFSTNVDDERGSSLDALDDYAPDGREDASTLDELGEYGPAEVTEHGGDALAAVEPVAPDDNADNDAQMPLISATNPPGTVTVTAHLDGLVQQVELSASTTTMTESQLAEEVRVVADVAAKKATSAMYIFMVELMVAQGIGRETAETFMQSNMSLATPQQARAAEVELAARHSHRHD
jgi:ESX secretion-associated protein EspD/H